MPRLFLVRHARSVADDILEAMHHDPLHQSFQYSLKQDIPFEGLGALASELHRRYRLPGGINEVGLGPGNADQIVVLGQLLVDMGVRPKQTRCSTLPRARTTLEGLGTIYPVIIGGAVTHDVRLAERQRGVQAQEFASLQIYLALNQDELRRKVKSPPFSYRPPGGESLRDVRVRASLVLSEILAELDDGDTLLVTHHTVIHALRHQLEQWPENDFYTKLTSEKPPNCGMLVYSLDQGGVSLVHRSW